MPTLQGLRVSQPIRKVWSTLRVRLAILNALAVALICLVALLLVRQGVVWALHSELDQMLSEDAQEINLVLRDFQHTDFSMIVDELQRKALGHQQHGWFIQLFDANHQLVWQSQGGANPPFTELILEENTPVTIGPYRVINIQKTSHSHGVEAFYVGANLRSIQSQKDRVDQLMAIALMAMGVMAPLSGYWLAGQVTKTIRGIISTAGKLRPSQLDERLTVYGNGDELDQLSITINGLLDRIAEYLVQRQDFLANAAHELRTPLAAIRSSVEVALDGREMTEEEQSLLEDIISESNSLEILVNQLLILTETETSPWTHRPDQVSLHEIISKATEMFQGVADEKEIRLVFSRGDHVTVSGSQRHLRQVINNLIDNAVKYTQRGGQIQITLQALPESGIARFRITDSGVGIPAEDIGKVFDRFYRGVRGRGRGPEIQGTGLGLSICQAVVNAHSGTIRCESIEHEGTTIEVDLPLSRKAAGSVQQGKSLG